MPDVDIDLVKPSPYQPRLLFNLDDLKGEIQHDGLLSALVVRKKDEYYELIDGERRLRVLRELGWKQVPVVEREVDDRTARRSVFKVNKIRENYTVEEEARYYKKLADEDMTAWEISEELGVNFHWVLANLNVFKLPQDMQALIFTAGQQLTVSHIQELERTFGRSTEEAIESVKVILERHLRVSETRELAQERDREAEERARQARLDAAKKALPEITPEATELETPEDYEKAAVALRRVAQRQREEAMTPEEKATREAERKAKAEAQAATKVKREEEKRQKKAEEEQRRQERADRKAREQLKGDKTFVTEALKAMPEEEVVEMLDMVPIRGKVEKVKSAEEEFDQIMKMASNVVDNLDKLKREGTIEQIDLKRFSITLRILADCLDEFAKLAEGRSL